MNNEWITEVERITEDMLDVLLFDIASLEAIRSYWPLLNIEEGIPTRVTPIWNIMVKYDMDNSQGHLITVLNYLDHNGFGFYVTEEGGVYTVTAEKPNLDTSD